jgi:predicted lactoylglutathione lyase
VKGDEGMPQDYWMSLPVKNLEKSKKFFETLGFSTKENNVNGIKNVQLVIGEKEVYIMLFENPIFKSFSRNNISNTLESTEILFSVGVETKEELDEIFKKAVANGGKSFTPPEEVNGMYSCGFCDLDGHRWNILYMDLTIE